MPASPWASKAALHATLRWVGVALFFCGMVAFALNFGAALTGRGTWGRAFFSLVSMALSLASFGTNNDTAIHAMAQLARENLLPARFAGEWAHELAVRPEKARHPHATPVIALVFPLLAGGLVGFMLWRGLTAWALLP